MNISHFDKNVFINCPFDEAYLDLLKPLLFTIRYCRLVPRIALERLDSSEIRLDKIVEIITASKYSIHDLSRIRSTEKGEYYRLNMPLEIGLDLGCKLFHPDELYRQKKSLILEAERYSIHKALSDLSGSDVKCHDNDPEKLIEVVRNWLTDAGHLRLPGPNHIWYEYNLFNAYLFDYFTGKGFKAAQVDRLPLAEYLDALRTFILGRFQDRISDPGDW